MRNPRPMYTAFQAVSRAWALRNTGVYQLGTGNATTPDGNAMDCCGFATCKAYGIIRHRPGFNRGSWATVSDDINCNSSIEDATHERDLFEVINRPELGALLKYPTIRIRGQDGELHEFMGHEGIVVGLSRALEWDATNPDYSLLDVMQCRGPNGRRPGIVLTDGSVWERHDALWSKPEHRTWMLRVKP